MDNETGTNDNESEVVESSEQINENGCNEPTQVEAETEAEAEAETESVSGSEHKESAAEPEQSDESDQKVDQPDEQKEEASSSLKPADPIDEPQIESVQFAIIDSDNPSESSPEKSHDVACIVSSPSEVECDESANDKSWNQSNESSPEKSRSDVACIVSSPSEAECEESANDKSWNQLNESAGEGIYDDSIDDEAESDDDNMDNDFIDRSSPKTVQFKEHTSEIKPVTASAAVECPVFELTDDNSSVDDARSEVDDDIDGDDIDGEEEEDMSGACFTFFFIDFYYTFYTPNNVIYVDT